MGDLSDELRSKGYRPTGETSPIDESGQLWSNSHEIICDETGVVIDGNHHAPPEEDDEVETRCGEVVFRYENSENVKLIGGFTSNYFD